MTGPEHYRRAEALLRSTQLSDSDVDSEGVVVEAYPGPAPAGADPELYDDQPTIALCLAAAQVHATLALAAAAAEPIADKIGGDPHDITMAWSRAIS